MRYLLLGMALAGCNTEWSWSETFDGTLVLDESTPEAWVGWEVLTEVYSDEVDEVDEVERTEVDLSDEDDDGVDAVRVRVVLQADIQPRDGEITVRMLNWATDANDHVDQPVDHMISGGGTTLEVVGPWVSCESNMACVFSEERSIDLRSSGQADVNVHIVVEGEVESGSTVSEDSRVISDVWWTH